MAYTTVAKVKNELPFNYQKGAEKKLTEDGFISAAGTFNETSFLTQFVDQAALFIDDYVSVVAIGPFATNGILEKINRHIAVYDSEMYIVSATQDRTVSVSIYAMRKEAMDLLKSIVKGDIILLPDEGASATSGSVQLIEPENDGATLGLGEIEEKILLGGPAESSEIPE